MPTTASSSGTYFQFHFYDGKAPIQVLAGNREAAEAYVRSQYGSNFTSAGTSTEPKSGYQIASAGIAGYQPANPGGVGATGDTGGAGGLLGGLENRFRKAAYERGLQRQGQNPEGLFSNYLNELYDPAFATFAVGNVLSGREVDDPENAFQNWTAATPISSIRGKATQTFRDLTNSGAPRTGDAASLLDRYRDPYGMGMKGAPDQEAIDELIALAGQSAATKYSPVVARRFLPSGQDVQSRYARQGLKGNFLDHLKAQYGLTGGF